jgi:hypothetical protein
MKTATLAPKVHPRISLNKLGEYMQATTVRRRTIIRDQKKPPGAGVLAWYSHVNATLTDYFEHPDPALIRPGASQDHDRKAQSRQVRNCLAGREPRTFGASLGTPDRSAWFD